MSDGNGDLGAAVGSNDNKVFIPAQDPTEKGFFDVLTHKDSFITKMAQKMGGGAPFEVEGPFGEYKYLNNGSFYE